MKRTWVLESDEKRRRCIGALICRIAREKLFSYIGEEESREAATARQVGKLKLKCSIDFKEFVSAENRGITEEASDSSTLAF